MLFINLLSTDSRRGAITAIAVFVWFLLLLPRLDGADAKRQLSAGRNVLLMLGECVQWLTYMCILGSVQY